MHQWPWRTAAHDNTLLQNAVSHCNTLYQTISRCNTEGTDHWPRRTAMYCTTLQHTVSHCSTLQHTATHCRTLSHTATQCNKLHCTATQVGYIIGLGDRHLDNILINFTSGEQCNTLQHTDTLQHTATHCNTLQHTATHCNTLRHRVTC